MRLTKVRILSPQEDPCGVILPFSTHTGPRDALIGKTLKEITYVKQPAWSPADIRNSINISCHQELQCLYDSLAIIIV